MKYVPQAWIIRPLPVRANSNWIDKSIRERTFSRQFVGTSKSVPLSTWTESYWHKYHFFYISMKLKMTDDVCTKSVSTQNKLRMFHYFNSVYKSLVLSFKVGKVSPLTLKNCSIAWHSIWLEVNGKTYEFQFRSLWMVAWIERKLCEWWWAIGA